MATAPQAAQEMPQQGANPFADPNTMAVYEQMRQTVSPKEFGDQMLAGAEQAAPEEVAAFRSALEQIELPPEALDLLNNMVDEILANPEQYAEIRAKYKEMGAPDEILPEQFDPQFFAALNMAVDQMIGEPAGEQAFAKGGIAELTPVSKAIANYGRNGDTMLAHITPAEARMLRRKGGSGSINPKTGLPEFFNLFKEIGNAFKSVGNAVKKFANSTVGRIITTVALGFFLGPAAASFMGVTSAAGVAAVSGFVGSAGATLAGGGNLSQALKAGAVGGLTAGATAGVTGAFGGTNAFASGSYSGAGLTPMEALQGQADKFTGAFTSPPFPQYTAQGALTDNATANAAREAYAGELYKTNPEAFYNPPAEPTIAADSIAPKKVTIGGGPVTQSVTPGGATVTQNAMGFDYAENNPLLTPEQRIAGLSADPTRTFGAAPSASATTAAAGNTIAPPIQAAATPANPYGTPTLGESLSTTGKGIMQMLPGTDGTFSEGFNNFTKGAGEILSPGPSSGEITARAKDILGADTTGKMTYNDALKAATAEGPGMFRSYAPATALGIGAIGAFGGFSPKAAPVSPYQDLLTGGPGSARDLLNRDPSRYYVQNLPGVNYYNGSVIKPPGMADGGEVEPQHFFFGGVASSVIDGMRRTIESQKAKDAAAKAEAEAAFLRAAAADPGAATAPGAPTTPGAAKILPRARLPYFPPPSATELRLSNPGPLPMGTSPNTGGITGLSLPAQQRPVYTPIAAAPRATPASQNLPELPKDLTTERELGAKQARALKDYRFAMNDKRAAFMNMGGIAGLAQGGYPRRTGQIQGPGTETSDSIPAMLSDGEFVMTAKAVRGAGKGDRRAGAKRMYSLMHQLEKNAARG